MSPTDSHAVWSSDSGDLRKKNLTPASFATRHRTACAAVQVSTSWGSQRARGVPAPNQQTTYLHRDSKDRGGKGVTLIRNLVLSEEDLSTLAKQIKQACGAGGTVKGGVIEIQGANRERITEVLLKLGYKVKMAGE